MSEYLKKQIQAASAADGSSEDEEIKRMLNDHDKLVEEIFQHEDKDKNGFLSHDEFSGPKHDELWKSIIWQNKTLRTKRKKPPCSFKFGQPINVRIVVSVIG